MLHSQGVQWQERKLDERGQKQARMHTWLPLWGAFISYDVEVVEMWMGDEHVLNQNN